MLRRTFLTASLALAGLTPRPSAAARLVDVRKIWDAAPHNAFTDLVRHRGEWFCVFREGQAHVSPDGALRVLVSRDGEQWESAARITDPKSDLRDAKITVMPDGKLMLSGAGALHQPAPARHQSYSWFSEDGRRWSDAVPVGDPELWLWRTTWHKGVGYGIGYHTNPDRPRRYTRLYATRDGRKYETRVDRLLAEGSAGEHALAFLPDDSVVCLQRRDIAPFTALVGTSRPPYTEWSWKELGPRIGGPTLLRLPDGRLLAATRLHDGKVRTALSWLDPRAGTLTEFLTLPSGGDSSYAGLVLHEGLLRMSYYSSHEGKTSIYLARVEL